MFITRMAIGRIIDLIIWNFGYLVSLLDNEYKT
jgi:hypothetical protein